MVGVSRDLIQHYLARLRADLRTPAERIAQILAEAEDHLRESIAAGVAIGMTEREAQEAAISAFGCVAAVVRAHRRPAAAVAEVAMEVWKLAAIYLLAVPVADLALSVFFYQIVHLHTVTPVPATNRLVVTNSPPDVVGLVAGLGASAIAGLALLLGYRRIVSWGFKMLGAAAVVASVLVALSYTTAIAMRLARQGRDGGTTDQEARYAG